MEIDQIKSLEIMTLPNEKKNPIKLNTNPKQYSEKPPIFFRVIN